MAPADSPSATVETGGAERGTAGDSAPDAGDVLLYGLVGGVVGSALSFVPLATVLGGSLAGYLVEGEPIDGIKAGTVAGVAMALPFAALVFFFLFLLGFAGAPAEFGVLALGVIAVAAVYTVGSGIAGGLLGNYLVGEP